MWHRTISLLVAFVALGLLVATFRIVDSMGDGVQRMDEGFERMRESIIFSIEPHDPLRVTSEASMVQLVYSYESAECGTVTVTTTQGIAYDGSTITPPETREQCKDRHRAEIAAWKVLCPPV